MIAESTNTRPGRIATPLRRLPRIARRGASACALLLALSSTLFATATVRGEVPSGPQPGEAAASLKAFAVSGEPKERDVDYAAVVKEHPAIVVFVTAKEFDRPMFRFLKKLDGDLPPETRLIAVWLAEDAAKSKEYLPKITQYFNRANLAVFDGVAGPNGWGVNLDARLTAVVLKNGKTVKSFGYVSLNETNVPEVLEALK
ncbi:MAG: hypothetical protein RLY70_984 [Planctomycetota bacterium]